MEKMSKNTNAINWFEIPAADIVRAKKFYEAIFEIEMHEMEMGGMKMAGFPGDGSNAKVGGALVQSNMHKVSTEGGTILYLNGNPDLQIVLDRITTAGGTVVMPKTLITEQIGYMAFFVDSEGNTIALHSGS